MNRLLHYIILLIVASAAVGCGGSYKPPIIESFSTKDWVMKNGEFPFNHRINIVGDLDQNYIKVGMNRTEVIDLLGESEKDVQRLIGYTLFEQVDSVSGDFIGTELIFLFDQEGNKVIKIYYQERIDEQNNWRLAYESVKKYAKKHLKSNYTLMDQSAGLVKLYYGKDGKRFYDQKHLGVPIHIDSVKTPYSTYYLLNDQFKIVKVSRKSFKGTLRD